MKENLLKKYPDIYKNMLNEIIDKAKSIYDNNLVAIFLAGSLAKGNFIKDWSDIDLYIITKYIDFNSNLAFYEYTLESKIHIGTTFYTVDMVKNLNVDLKTKAAFYEYHEFNVNDIIYGDVKIPYINYEKFLSYNTSFDDVFQTVQRELYSYEINRDNLKTLIKKTTLLMKMFLNLKYHKFVYGYENVFNTFRLIVNKDVNIDINNVIKAKDENNKLINQIKLILLDTKKGMMENEKN